MADDSDTVTIRSEFGEEKEIQKDSVPFFVHDDEHAVRWVVLTSDGRVNTKATSAATTTKEQ